MSKQKRLRTIETAYDRMHLEILRGTKRHRWAVFTMVLAISFAVMYWMINSEKYPLPKVMSIIFIGSCLIIVIPLLVVLLIDNLLPTDSEHKLVNIALNFLRKENFQPHLLETLDNRAEIGSSAGQIRTLLPILAIPIIIPLLISFRNVEQLAELLFDTNQSLPFLTTVGICVISFCLFRELDRTNNDVVIRHAIAEYRCEQEDKKLYKQDQTEISFIEQLIMTNEL